MAVWAILCDASFLKVAGVTILRGLIGFAAAITLGLLMGVCGGRHPLFHSYMKPWIVVIRSTPIVAFILIAVVLFSSDQVPVVISVITMFPIVYLNIAEGIRSVNPHGSGLLSLLSSIRGFVFSGVSTAMGFGWRAVVMGEVISQPQWGIGVMMQGAKVSGSLDILIAWTLVIVLISAVTDKILSFCRRFIS